MKKSFYRSEIDGLRAIAVAAVVIYHAGISLFGSSNFLSSGFFGVDIFFVISGYLITALLIKEINNGDFSYFNFYERRLRRIVPVLLVVMLVSLPFAYKYLLPHDIVEYSWSILSSLAFISNAWFYHQIDYWDTASELKPFLHTWSLSVEEQFYIVMPIMILLILKVRKNWLLVIVSSVCLSSFLFAINASANLPQFSFYMLPTRAWELGAGSMLASFEYKYGRFEARRLNSIFPKLGLLFIFISLSAFSSETTHPSYWTLLPVVGTVMIIAFASPGELVTRLLSLPIFVFIGLVSYGFYLWHFPIFAFSKLDGGMITNSSKVFFIIVSFGFATTSYFFIEQPLRKSSIISLKKFSLINFAMLFFILIVLFSALKTEGWAFRDKKYAGLVDYLYWHRNDRENYKLHFNAHPKCWLPKENTSNFEACQFHEKEGKKKVLVIGDSNMASVIPGLVRYYGRDSLAQRTIDSCLPFLPHTDAICNRVFVSVLDEIELLDPEVIIVGGRYRNTEHIDQVISFIENHLQISGKKVFLYGPLPRWDEMKNPSGLPNKLKTELFETEYKFQLYGRLLLKPDDSTFSLNNYLKSAAREKTISFLSPVDEFCISKERQCLAKLGSEADSITSFDYGHLTHKASIYMINKMKRKINGLDHDD